MINSIEELIKIKLNTAITEQKKKIAEGLLFSESMSGTSMGQSSGLNKDKHNSERKSKKTEQIKNLRQRISDIQSKISTAKDPTALKNMLLITKEKLDIAQKELSNIK